jgi:hypothetical protein
MSLSTKTMLTTLNISQWSARKLDKRETEAVAIKHGTSDNVARVSKTILPSAVSLEAIHKKTNDVRKFFYDNTLPWQADGVAILKATHYMKFVEEMGKLIREWEGLVSNFLHEYPTLRSQAAVAMNGLYNPDDYPDEYDLEKKFQIGIRFMPMPDAGDWRVDIADEEVVKLRDHLEEQTKAGVQEAMKEVWSRLSLIVEHAAEKLSQPDAIFRNSLVENARKLCEVLPSLNITDDPNLTRMGEELKAKLADADPDLLRTRPTEREKAARDMQDMMSKMAGFFGPGGK